MAKTAPQNSATNTSVPSPLLQKTNLQVAAPSSRPTAPVDGPPGRRGCCPSLPGTPALFSHGAGTPREFCSASLQLVVWIGWFGGLVAWVGGLVVSEGLSVFYPLAPGLPQTNPNKAPIRSSVKWQWVTNAYPK